MKTLQIDATNRVHVKTNIIIQLLRWKERQRRESERRGSENFKEELEMILIRLYHRMNKCLQETEMRGEGNEKM